MRHDLGQAFAVVDHKEARAYSAVMSRLKNNANLAAISRLYTEHGQQMPAFIAFYHAGPPIQRRVVCLNRTARDLLGATQLDLDEPGFVRLMMSMRGLNGEAQIAKLEAEGRLD